MPAKLQRWTDLIAALLACKYPVTFEQLAADVPGYAGGLDPRRRNSVKRTFERDKDELKAFGIHIKVVTVEKGKAAGYKYTIDPKRFYLPYLHVAKSQWRVKRPDGYRSLPQIDFEPDEIETLVHALSRLDALGNPKLREVANSALAKIAFDVPGLPAAPDDVVILGTDRVTPAIFEALSQALQLRKSVTFSYRSPAASIKAPRSVQPFGLFFIHAHWYLAAFDAAKDAVRNFRLSRMSAVKVNRDQPKSPDFNIPASFRLQEHARSRDAWDLGDGEPLAAEVQFTRQSGVARAAASNGAPVHGRADVRMFAVRRADTFARWLLSFAGDAVPLSPPELVTAWRALARGTLERYDRH